MAQQHGHGCPASSGVIVAVLAHMVGLVYCGPCYAFSALLDGRSSPVFGEFVAREDGQLEVVPLEQQSTTAALMSSGSGGATALFGRGLGTWRRRSSGVLEAELQLYVYTIAQQPDEPSELLLICRDCTGHESSSDNGELRGCIFEAGGERVQVGTVRALPLPSRRLYIARSVRPVAPPAYEKLPPLDSRFLAAQEGAARAEPALACGALLDLERFRVGHLDAVYYIPDFVTLAEEAEISAQLAGSPEEMWRSMAGRRVQECGTTMAPSGAGLLIERLPPWMRRVCARLVETGAFPLALHPNSIALNEYTRHEGIAAHADGPIYAPRVAILSLFSPAVLRFYGRQPELPSQTAWSEETDTPAHSPAGEPVETLLLRPRSLLLFAGQAYREHCHEVAALEDGTEVLTGTLVNGNLADASEGDVVERGDRRVSLTIRHVLEFLLAPEAYHDLLTSGSEEPPS